LNVDDGKAEVVSTVCSWRDLRSRRSVRTRTRGHAKTESRLQSGKAGVLWKSDRVTGQFIGYKEMVHQTIGTPSIQRQERRPIVPTSRDEIRQASERLPQHQKAERTGRHDLQPPTGLLIVPLNQSCWTGSRDKPKTVERRRSKFMTMPGTTATWKSGRVRRQKQCNRCDSRATSRDARRRGLDGRRNRNRRNIDRPCTSVGRQNGKVLWESRLGTAYQGSPITYSVGGSSTLPMTGLGGAAPAMCGRNRTRD